MCWVALLCLCSRQSGSPESFGVVKKAFIKKVGHLHQVPNSIYLGYSPSFVVVLSVIKFFKFDVPSILVWTLGPQNFTKHPTNMQELSLENQNYISRWGPFGSFEHTNHVGWENRVVWWNGFLSHFLGGENQMAIWHYHREFMFPIIFIFSPNCGFQSIHTIL